MKPYKTLLPLILPEAEVHPLPSEIAEYLDLEKIIDTKVRREGECLHWEGGLSHTGMPVVSLNVTSLSVRPLQYARHHGPVPDGLVVGVTCGRETCLEPAHLIARKKWSIRSPNPEKPRR